MRNLFVTGTDTDAGKTVTAAGIVAEFRRSGIDAIPVKPVQTGCVNDAAPDLQYCLDICSLSPSKAEKDELAPLRFSTACSPHLAAAIEERRIDLSGLTRRIRAAADAHDCAVAEGAGGVLVPLGGGFTMLDLMRELDWPVVLTVCNRLGAINHSLLSIRALKSAGLEVAGFVINHSAGLNEPVRSDNGRTIAEYGNVPLLGEIPWSPESFPAEAFRGICSRLKEVLRK